MEGDLQAKNLDRAAERTAQRVSETKPSSGPWKVQGTDSRDDVDYRLSGTGVGDRLQSVSEKRVIPMTLSGMRIKLDYDKIKYRLINIKNGGSFQSTRI